MKRDNRFYVKSLCARIDDQGRILTELRHSSTFYLQRVAYISKNIVDSDSSKKTRTSKFRRNIKNKIVLEL
jgi:hypothetical protein